MRRRIRVPGANRDSRRETLERRAERARVSGIPKNFFYEDEVLHAAVLANPDADEPRLAYASWFNRHHDEDTKERATCVIEGIDLARAARANPRLDFETMRAKVPIMSGCWGDLEPLFDDGLASHPRVHRGFVESIAIRAADLPELAEEIFATAPIRFLMLVDTNRGVEQLASWPGLSRMHAISFPVFGDEDLLTDETIDRLLQSPYLTNIAAIQLIDQTQLTSAAYRRIVTAPTLPKLSLFDVPPKVLTCFAQPVEVWKTDGERHGMPFFEHTIIAPPKSGDLRDTPKLFIQRPEDWIVELERELGYQPCLHPEEHYGRYHVALEVPIEHPIALDPAIMARRGQPVPEPGPKPSVMERYRKGLCAICGDKVVRIYGSPGDPYGDPMGLMTGSMDCEQCGTSWFVWDEAE